MIRKRNILALVVGVFLLAGAVVKADPVRLGIVATEKSLESAGELLTVELSKDNRFALLERAQIERVFQEQSIASYNAESLVKLGHLLGSDGLVVLAKTQDEGSEFLNLRLVAVKPGVILLERKYPLPLKDLTDWTRQLGKLVAPFAPKLRTLSKDALPVSVLNLRSSVQSAQTAEHERVLTQLLIHRLANEPDVFILERQNMSAIVFEKEQNADNSPFWTGRYVLDGTLDKDGFSADKVTITARLIPPRGGGPLLITAEGPRQQPGVVIEKLAGKVMEALRGKPSTTDWNPEAESFQFQEEAKWAFRWKMYREAQEASESAWALGKHSKELSVLRLQSYMDDGVPKTSVRFGRSLGRPAAARAAGRALELFVEDSDTLLSTNSINDKDALLLGAELLARTAEMLQVFYDSLQVRRGNEEQLAKIRDYSRKLTKILENHLYTETNPTPQMLMRRPHELSTALWKLEETQWELGGLWFETPEDAIPMYRRMLKRGFHPKRLPHISGWRWEARKRNTAVRNDFFDELSHSSDAQLRLDGLLLKMVQAPFDEKGSLLQSENALVTELDSQRETLLAGEAGILTRAEEVLREKYGGNYGGATWANLGEKEPLRQLYQKLRKEYLAGGSSARSRIFDTLFWDNRNQPTELEVRELMPLFSAFETRAKLEPGTLEQRLAKRPRTSRRQLEESKSEPVQPAPRKNGVVSLDFTGWKLAEAGIDGGLEAEFAGWAANHGEAWAQIRFRSPGYFISNKVLFVGLRGKACTLVPFPDNIKPDPISHFEHTVCFETTGESLLVSAQKQLMRYRFREKTWESIPVPMDQGAVIREQDGRIYLGTKDSVMEVSLDTKEVRILASCRRRPALNPVDQLGSIDYGLFRGADGLIGIAVSNSVYRIDPPTRVWKAIANIPDDVQGPHGFGSRVSFGLNGRGEGSIIDMATRGRVRVPVQFEKNGKPCNPEDPNRNEQPPDSMLVFGLGSTPKAEWCNTREGIVVISRAMDGHWFISKSEYETKLAGKGAE